MAAHKNRNIIEVILDTIRGKVGHTATVDACGHFVIRTPNEQPYNAICVIGSAAPGLSLLWRLTAIEEEIKHAMNQLNTQQKLAQLPDVLWKNEENNANSADHIFPEMNVSN